MPSQTPVLPYPSAPSTCAAKILIVDDEYYAVEMLKVFVAHLGLEPLAAFNGRDAIEIVRRDRPNLVLLDIMMPDMDGLKVLERLRAESPSTAIVMVTAVHDDAIGSLAIEMGAFDYVTKPIDLEQLEKVIRWKMATD